MVTTPISQAQHGLFDRVCQCLADIGYRGDLLQRNYTFRDWFLEDEPERTAAAVAFAQTPFGYDSACFAVLIPNGRSDIDLVRDYRALGAPRAFEVRDNKVIHWKVAVDPTASDGKVIRPDNLSRDFLQYQDDWNPVQLLRARNIGEIPSHQTDFVDLGLIPALEEHVRAKLDPLLITVLATAQDEFITRKHQQPNWDRLCRLMFRVIYGKIMRDRGLLPSSLSQGIPPARKLLAIVAEQYGDDQPVLEDNVTQHLVIEKLWKGVDFKHLSVETLAFIWENLLVTKTDREALSIHATPPNIARYMVRRLELDHIPQEERRITEPCCGSGTFLIAAMQKLRELLPPDTAPSDRHDYFVNMLSGFDIEQFGLEVARPCLMLADFPNPNGWELKRQDVFNLPQESPAFFSALRQARIVLCNPPFRSFDSDERDQYPSIRSTLKPVELLNRVLDNLPNDGILGFVLPATAISGKSYRSIRMRLAERYSELEVVVLPEGVFRNARFPTIILMARNPSGGHEKVRMTFASVTDGDTFVRKGFVDRSRTELKSIDCIRKSLAVYELQEIWDYLPDRTLRTDSPLIQRGVEWKDFKKNAHNYIIGEPKRGFVPGLHTADEMSCFESPPLMYLWDDKESQKYKAWELPWHFPKVVCNAVRKSRGPWRLVACPVELNVLCSQNFMVIWPRPPWTAKSMAAVLNGPIANAFVATHEDLRHNKKETFWGIPLPALSGEQIARLDTLVGEYQSLAAIRRDYGSNQDLFGIGPTDDELRNLLLEIDSLVLRGYQLSRNLKRELLSYFQGATRPVPFPFDSADIGAEWRAASGPPDQDRRNWELLKKAMEEDNLSEGTLFR